jgi:hypothetical protein
VKPKRPDCRSCGLCCMSLHDQEAYCDVEPEDLERLPRAWVRKNVMFSSGFDMLCSAIDGGRAPYGAIRTAWKQQRRGPLKGITACVCVALRGSMMQRVGCSIYSKRPRACREALNPGDKECLEARRMLTEATLREMAAEEEG